MFLYLTYFFIRYSFKNLMLKKRNTKMESRGNDTLNEQTKLTSASNETKPSVEVKSSSDNRSTFVNILLWVLKYLVSMLIGFVFGYAMEKSKVHEPISIRQQMIFKKFIMIKMFLAAFATSTFSIFFVALLFKDKYEKILKGGQDALKNKNLIILVSGGLLIGVGMQISGACPGMVLVQLGAGVPWSYLTLIGAFAGALFHGLLNEYLTSNAKPDAIVSKTLFQVTRIHPVITRIVFFILLGSVVFVLEYFIPWTQEYANPYDDNQYNILTFKAWPPYSESISF